MIVRDPDWEPAREPGRQGDPSSSPRDAFGPPRDDRRLERLVSAGRQLVDGVAGTRPGSRPAGRPTGRAAARPRLDSLGRWVENRLDWLLEDGDDWREPWQEPNRELRRPPRQESEAPRRDRPPLRQPLEAISRRGSRRDRAATGLNAAAPTVSADDAWPDDTAFTVPRWQRGDAPPPADPAPPQPGSAAAAPGRALPRSSRRRS